MRNPSVWRLARPMMAVAAVVLLAGCSSGGRFAGPSWNLTGGKAAAPIPPRPVHGPQDRQAEVPPPVPPPVPVYRGGRDPITGRAPGWGAPPPGFTPSAPEPAPAPERTAPVQPPSHLPARPASTRPKAADAGETTQPPVQARVAGHRAVEVRPGQSLAVIAAENRVSIASLMSTNKLRDPYVYPGQVLVLPPR